MSDWIGAARSSYFAVKDEAAFRAWVKKRGLHVLEPQRALPRSIDGKVAPKMFAVAPEEGGWPAYDLEASEELNLVAELAELIQVGQIVVFHEVGADKLRYMTGHAVAFDNTGKSVSINLEDIYERAADYFDVTVTSIPKCQY